MSTAYSLRMLLARTAGRNVGSRRFLTIHTRLSKRPAANPGRGGVLSNNNIRGRQLQSSQQQPRLAVLLPQQRRIHFLPLLGLWGAKHVSVWTIYNACKSYGWPRVYRRLLEQHRSMQRNNPGAQVSSSSINKDLIRMAIEAPPKFAAQVGQHADSVTKFLHTVAERAEPNLPQFLVAAIKFVVNSQKPVKILQDFVGATATSKK